MVILYRAFCTYWRLAFLAKHIGHFVTMVTTVFDRMPWPSPMVRVLFHGSWFPDSSDAHHCIVHTIVDYKDCSKTDSSLYTLRCHTPKRAGHCSGLGFQMKPSKTEFYLLNNVCCNRTFLYLREILATFWSWVHITTNHFFVSVNAYTIYI